MFLFNMFEKIVKKGIEYFLIEVQKDENQKLIKTYLVDTTICYILEKLSPYIMITFTIFILLLLLTISIMVLLLKNKTTL